jgi:hypothetical protein
MSVASRVSLSLSSHDDLSNRVKARELVARQAKRIGNFEAARLFSMKTISGVSSNSCRLFSHIHTDMLE